MVTITKEKMLLAVRALLFSKFYRRSSYPEKLQQVLRFARLLS